MWYDDPGGREALKAIGLIEIESGRWASPDMMREITDFGHGIIVITRISLERPEFDVQTVHSTTEKDRDLEFLNYALDIHLNEISRRTKEIKENGIGDLIGSRQKS
jgi:hypothetical protein